MFEQESLALLRDGRMYHRFEAGQRSRVAENLIPRLVTQDAFRPGTTRKCSLYLLDQSATRSLHGAHFGIGIEDRHASRLEHGGNGRLPHADGAGKAEGEGLGHAFNLSRSSASNSRGGRTPKKCTNAEAAWPISMESPSMVSNPASRAL